MAEKPFRPTSQEQKKKWSLEFPRLPTQATSANESESKKICSVRTPSMKKGKKGKNGKKLKKAAMVLETLQDLDRNIYGTRPRRSREEDLEDPHSDEQQDLDQNIYSTRRSREEDLEDPHSDEQQSVMSQVPQVDMAKEADLFCLLLAQQLKALNAREYYNITHDIQVMVFNIRRS